jgi:hypothetical protein
MTWSIGSSSSIGRDIRLRANWDNRASREFIYADCAEILVRDFRVFRMNYFPEMRIIQPGRKAYLRGPGANGSAISGETVMEFILMAAGAVAALGFTALIPRDRRDAIRDASAGFVAGQLFPAPGSWR